MIKKLLPIILGLSCLLVLGPGVNSGGVFPETDSVEPVKAGWSVVQSGSWFSNWTYRKAHNITGSTAGVQVNYPVGLNVHYDSGFDYEGDVYLDAKCKVDFGDIRFTDSVGSILDCWVQHKVDGDQALFWIEVNYIPEYPDHGTIYIYYGNSNATTTSNKDWVFELATGFEDGTTQGWIISWSSYTCADGVSTTTIYEGNYSRMACRQYGSNKAGTGDFYDGFLNTVHLSAGSYRMEATAMHYRQTSYVIPKDISLFADDVIVDSVINPDTQWHWLSGNFTLDTAKYIELEIEFHLLTSHSLLSGAQEYFIDRVFIRKWCDPEPTHGSWGTQETSDDNTPPQIISVEWTPTSSYPYDPSNTTRTNEPVSVMANVSEEESGLNSVILSYSVDNSEWWNTSMTFNSTTNLWTATIPGQSNTTDSVEFFITAHDNAGNKATSQTYNYGIQSLILGDINGDGKVDMKDIGRVARNFGRHS